MATWTNIPDTALEPGKPARSVDALALRDNPIAIAERTSGAPWAKIGLVTQINNGAGNWTVPGWVSRLIVTCIGAGQGAAFSHPRTDNNGNVIGEYWVGGGSGGDTVFGGITAGGGNWTAKNGWVSGNGGIAGEQGRTGRTRDGSGGAIVKIMLDVTPNQVIAYSVGAGGTGNGYPGAGGGSGQIIIEY